MIAKIDLEKLKGILIMIIGSLVAVNIVNLLYGEPLWQINRLIGLGRESNFSTWFSSIMLAIAAFIAYQCTLMVPVKTTEKKTWALFSLLLLVLACDETAMIHEFAGLTINKYVYHLGHLHSVWTILLGPAVLIFTAVFAWQLNKYLTDSKQAKKFLIYGVIFFISGALVLDSTTNLLTKEQMGIWKIEIILEESFEMIGVFLVILGLIEHYNHLSKRTNKNSLTEKEL